ncbi:DUF4177 domain-containing protein, partial [Dysosmobacter welbionis]
CGPAQLLRQGQPAQEGRIVPAQGHHRPCIQQTPQGMILPPPVQQCQVGGQADVQRHPLPHQPGRQIRVL